MTQDDIRRYLEKRKTELQSWLTHQPADTLLERVTFRWVDLEEGRKEERTIREPFGDHLKFLEHIQEQAEKEVKKPILILADSGLGKTWLLLRAFLLMAERWSEGMPVPFYLSLLAERRKEH